MVTGPKLMVALAATVVVAALVVVAAGAVIAARERDTGQRTTAGAPSQHTLLWTPGACTSKNGSRFDLTACNGGHAEVLAIAADPPGLDGCPADTDEIVRVGKGRTACLQYFLDPHPGRPGGGGGIPRAGDCLGRDGRELPCAKPGWYGRAVAVVARMEACPSGTADALAMNDDQVACLGSEGQVPVEGECVSSKVLRVPCASRPAWARVTAFATSGDDCPAGSDRYVTARGAFRPVTCLHLLSK
ncbi:hypothetical protein [Nonomuraea africana]|uniref:Uncharacterized protein n=1 Tax=Nonomuraea africana TaxID=46171 RepID=A0ABR9KMY3_9ACTN|nr:hypothetical protein [Nonomuraea africana]MBE1563374.1 hypothetical protein [Nonomuraea africana]